MIGILANESNGQLNNQHDSGFQLHTYLPRVTLKLKSIKKCQTLKNPYRNPCSKKPKLNHNMFEFDLLRFKSSGKK